MDGIRYAVEVLADNGCQDALDWELARRREFDDAGDAAEEYNGCRSSGRHEAVKMALVERADDAGEWIPEDIAAACLITPKEKTNWALARAALADGPLSRRDLASIATAAGATEGSVYSLTRDWHVKGRIVKVSRGVYRLPDGADPWWYGLDDEHVTAADLEERARAILSDAAGADDGPEGEGF